MKFNVEKVSKFSGRLGNIILGENNSKYQTPLLIQTTKSGNIPYLSREVFTYISNGQHVFEINLGNTEHMEESLKLFTKGIADFVGYPGFPVFLTLKDPCELSTPGYHEKGTVPLFTRKGKRLISPNRFMDIIECFKPNMFQTLCDGDTDEKSSKKRLLKSVERSELFFKNCLEIYKELRNLGECSLLASVVGGYCKKMRSQSINSVISVSDVSGYVIDGLHNYGTSASNVNVKSLKEIVQFCISELPHEKPKFILGAYTPLAVLEMISLGIDVFDTSYIYLTVIKNQALVFTSCLDSPQSEQKSLGIDLSDRMYVEDFNPILENCKCLSCEKHTRAYIHHLLNTKELLGPILLMIHNTHHYLKFFENIQHAIRDDTLPKLIDLITSQMSEELTEAESSEMHEK